MNLMMIVYFLIFLEGCGLLREYGEVRWSSARREKR
jgi:hypothetical protein